MDANGIENVRQGVANTSGLSVPANPAQVVTPPPEPEDDAVSLSDLAKKQAKDNMEKNADFHRKLSITGNNQVVVKLIDPKTRDVVRQTPPEEQLRLREAVRNAAKNFKSE